MHCKHKQHKHQMERPKFQLLLLLMLVDALPHCLQLCVVQILVAGGTSEYCANTKSPANNQSYLIDVSLHCSELLKVLMLE